MMTTAICTSRTSDTSPCFWRVDGEDRLAVRQVFGHSCGDCLENEDELLHSTASGVTRTGSSRW